MRTKTRAVAVALFAFSFWVRADAATLSLAPTAVTVTIGSVFTVDLVVSGLGDAVAPSVGAFDIDIGFDPLALGWIGSTLGGGLGDIAMGEAIDVSFGEVAPGVVNIAEVSFLTDGELNGMQSASFVLATLEFMLLAGTPGSTTAIDVVGVGSLGDVLGDPIAIDGVSGAVVTVAAIPLPYAVWLFASAIGVLALRETKR